MYAVIEAGGKQHKVELGHDFAWNSILCKDEPGVEHAFENCFALC